MSARDHLNPAQFSPNLTNAINEGKKNLRPMSRPEEARNACAATSNGFLSDMVRNGVRGGSMSVVTHGVSHVVNVAEGHVIDWTARQFDRRAPFPKIEPVSQFKEQHGVADPVDSTSRRLAAMKAFEEKYRR
jgi:hypothetical protein